MGKTTEGGVSRFPKKDEVLALMADGWTLASGSYIRGPGYAVLQKGKRGYGGATKNVHYATFESLRKSGQIEQDKALSDWRELIYKIAR